MMTRTPDEIKKGLEHCINGTSCRGCPYCEECATASDCNPMHKDLWWYIQQLEAERDAAVETVKQLKRCADCKHATIILDMTGVWVDCPKRDGRCSAKSLWEWRGAQKEERA